LSGVVLAGGESRRMGRDKRALLVDGQPLLGRVLAALAEVADDLVVVESARSPVPRDLLIGYAVRPVADRREDAGPLAGIEAGLSAAAAPLALVVAADAPSLQPALLRLLASELGASPEAEAALIVSDRGPEPLLAAYRSEVRIAASALLDHGERRMGSLLDELRVVNVGASVWRGVDPQGRSLRNVNEPADLA
jgi:molybdopterin-guanine dinucleotide biosynthesis protein A